jgi:hypothetical protein
MAEKVFSFSVLNEYDVFAKNHKIDLIYCCTVSGADCFLI